MAHQQVRSGGIVSTAGSKRDRRAMAGGAVAMAVMVALGATSAGAATITWNGASGLDANWSTPTNWTGGVVPGATSGTTNLDIALFTGTTVQQTVNLDQSYNVFGITFGGAAAATAYTIDAAVGASLLLSSGGTILNSDTQTAAVVRQTINAPMILQNAAASGSGTYTISANGSGPSATQENFLTIAGAFSGNATAGNTSTLLLNGSNNTRGVALSNVFSGVISDGTNGGNLRVNTIYSSSGSTTWILSGANTFSGGLSLSTTGFTGTLQIGNGTLAYNTLNDGSATPLGTGTVTLGTNGSNTLSFNGAGGVTPTTSYYPNNITFTGSNTLRVVDGFHHFTGTMTVNSGVTATLNISNPNKPVLLDGPLTGPGTVTLSGGGNSGPGYVSISNASTTGYTGTVNVNGQGGRGMQLQLANTAGLPAANVILNQSVNTSWDNQGTFPNTLAYGVGSSALVFAPGITTASLGSLASNTVLSGTNNVNGYSHFALVTVDPAGSQPVALTVGATNASTTYAGMITDGTPGGVLPDGRRTLNSASLGGSLIKTGSGTLTLGNLVTATTTFANGSQSATVPSIVGLAAGDFVSSANVPVGTYITAITGTTLTLSQAASAGGIVSAQYSMANTYSGGTSINGGTLVVNKFSLPSAGAVKFTGNSTLRAATALTVPSMTVAAAITGTIDSNGFDVTLNGPITSAGNGAITKINGGNLSLTGANTYSGNTLILGGQLTLSAGSTYGDTAISMAGGTQLNVLGSVTVGTGAASLTLAGGATPATRATLNMVDNTIGTLTLNGATGLSAFTLGDPAGPSTLNLELGNSGANDAIVLGNGSLLNRIGSGVINISQATGTTPAAGSYTLLSTGGLTGAGAITLGSIPANAFNYSLSLVGNNYVLNVISSASPPTAFWLGSIDSNWSTMSGSATNWRTTAAGTTDTNAVPGAATDVTFTATGATNFSNTELGADFHIKGLFISPGVSAVGIAGTGGKTLQLDAGITLDNTAGATISAAVAVSGAQTWAVNSAGTLAISGPISDVGPGGTITIAGAGGGTVLLSGNNTYTQGTTLNGSGVTLKLGSASALGSGPVVMTAGTLDLNNTTTNPIGALSGSASITNSATGTGTLSTTGGTYGGVIQDGGPGKLAALHQTAGTLTLTGANTYTGGTTIDAGATLKLGITGGPYGSLSDTGGVINNGILSFDPTPAPYAGNISGTGAVVVGNAGTQVLSGVNTYSGGTTIQFGGTLQLGSATALGAGPLLINGGAGTSTLHLNGNSPTVTTLNGDTTAVITNATGASTLTVSGGGTFSGAITDSGGTTALAVTGGTLLRPNDILLNSYSGGTSISNGGTLQVGFGVNPGANGSTLINTALGTGPVNITGGTLTLNTMPTGGAPPIQSTLLNNINLNGNATITSFEGENHLAGSVTTTGTNNVINVRYPNKPLILDGDFSGTGDLTLANVAGSPFNTAGYFQVTGTGNNADFTGSIILNETLNHGVQLVLGGNINLPNTTLNITGNLPGSGSQLAGGNGTVVIFQGTSETTQALGSLQSTTGGDIRLASLNGSKVNLVLGNADANPYSYAGVLSDTPIGGSSVGSSLTKVGSVSQTLTGVSTYTGNTNVNAGTLTIAYTGGLASSTIAVAAGAILNLNGAIPATATINDSGTVNFGGSTGAVSLSHTLGTLNIASNALVTITPSAFPFTPAILQPAVLSFADATAKVNLGNNELIVNENLTTAVGRIISGQIFSSIVGAGTGLGSLALSPTQTEIRYTLLGDTNLDGKVDVGDLGNLATSYGLTSGAIWAQGDGNYDGNVDVGDLGNLATNYGSQLGTSPSAGEGSDLIATSLASLAGDSGSAAVPEPATLGLLGLGAMSLLPRRRRR